MSQLPTVISLLGSQLPWFWPLVGVVLGGVTGSFLSCATIRLPHRQSMWQPPSECDHCHARLTLPDLVPLLSWLALRGRCRHCGQPYGIHNLVWEVTFILIGFLLGLLNQPGIFTPLIILSGLSGLALVICGLSLGRSPEPSMPSASRR